MGGKNQTSFKEGHVPTHKPPGVKRGYKVKPRGLRPREATFLEEYLRHSDGKRAALAAGYTEKSAHSRAYDLTHNPGPVRDAIEVARRNVMQKGEFNLEKLMAELNDGAAFARETGNATALAKFTELKAKACGLLIERIDQRQVGSFELVISGIDRPVKVTPPQPKVINNDDGGDIFA